MECRARIKELPIKVKFRHVKGHQDEKRKKDDTPLLLDWWAKENIRMDLAAKRHWRKTHKNPTPNHQFKHEKWAIWINGEKLSNFQKEPVHDRIGEQQLKDCWQKKHGMTDRTWDEINWDASKSAMKENPSANNDSG